MRQPDANGFDTATVEVLSIEVTALDERQVEKRRSESFATRSEGIDIIAKYFCGNCRRKRTAKITDIND